MHGVAPLTLNGTFNAFLEHHVAAFVFSQNKNTLLGHGGAVPSLHSWSGSIPGKVRIAKRISQLFGWKPYYGI